MVVPLNCLSPGQEGSIVWIAAEPDHERRLAEIGFSPGCSVLCLMKGPKGRMSAYMADGSVFGLREKDAQVVLVKVLR